MTSGPNSRLNGFFLFAFYLGVAWASVMMWARVTELGLLPGWHADMLSATAPAPNQYRPLTPWLAEVVRFLLPGHDLVTSYALVRVMVTGITLYFFDRYLRTWFRAGAAAAGALLLAAVLPFTYMRVIQESDPINLLIFTLAFWAMVKGRDLLLIPIMLIGTLNRESTAMLPVVYLIGNLGVTPIRGVVRTTIILVACWCVIYGGLRVFYGNHSYYSDVVMWQSNISNWNPSIRVLGLFGMVWVFSFFAVKSGPVLLRRTLLLLPFYLALHYIVALVGETRLFLPWAPVVIPLAWFTLFPSDVSRSGSSAGAEVGGGARRAGEPSV